MSEHVVGKVSDFPEGEGVPVAVDGIQIAIFNVGDDIIGIHDNCPHRNYPLNLAGTEMGGKVRGSVDCDDARIQCPWHDLEFDLETGSNEVLDTQLPVYTTNITEDNEVVLRV